MGVIHHRQNLLKSTRKINAFQLENASPYFLKRVSVSQKTVSNTNRLMLSSEVKVKYGGVCSDSCVLKRCV
jgi:hypothetical protein